MRPTWEETGRYCKCITKMDTPVLLKSTCEWIVLGGNPRFYRYSTPVNLLSTWRGVEGRSIDGSLFAKLFNQFLTMLYLKNFEVALFCLICRFGMVENQNNRSTVISGPICRLRRNLFFLYLEHCQSLFHPSYVAMTSVSANQTGQFIIQLHDILVGVFATTFRSTILIIHNLSGVWSFDK